MQTSHPTHDGQGQGPGISQVSPVSQEEHWNGAAGQAWVAGQQTLDALFQPFEQSLVAAAAQHCARQVLDVGCGTGSTTLAIAAAMAGQDGRCTGIDIARSMLALASERARGIDADARFVCADAQSHAFAPGQFDLVVSRFGVMFFADPVRAFANLRAAVRPGGALQFFAWRSPAENPFMTAGERAAAHLLPAPAPRAKDGPGQFAFADPVRVRSILEQAGWADVEIVAVDVQCAMPADRLPGYFSRMGPVGLALQALDEGARQPVLAALEAGFAPYVEGTQARFVAACWKVCARSSTAAEAARHSSSTAASA